MANAATLAGLAFSNAFVGVNHALAHAVGARFGIAARPGQRDLPAARAALQRGAAVASSCPRPATRAYVAPEKYAQIGWSLGLGGRGDEERRERLFAARRRAARRGRHAALAGGGRRRRATQFEAALPDLARAAFVDPSIRTNPRMPLIAELVGLLRAGYEGR